MFEQRIVRAFPPNYATLKKAFDLDPAAGVIFSYGELIFIPNQRTPLPPALVAHEAVHGKRQMAHPRGVVEQLVLESDDNGMQRVATWPNGMPKTVELRGEVRIVFPELPRKPN